MCLAFVFIFFSTLVMMNQTYGYGRSSMILFFIYITAEVVEKYLRPSHQLPPPPPKPVVFLGCGGMGIIVFLGIRSI